MRFRGPRENSLLRKSVPSPSAARSAYGPSPEGRGVLCAPGTGALLEVQVLPRAGHSERSEAQLRKGDRPWGGSVGRNCEPMHKNWIGGGADQGERARNREALVVKDRWRNPAVVQ